jgi:hypothetical protein
MSENSGTSVFVCVSVDNMRTTESNSAGKDREREEETALDRMLQARHKSDFHIFVNVFVGGWMRGWMDA